MFANSPATFNSHAPLATWSYRRLMSVLMSVNDFMAFFLSINANKFKVCSLRLD